MHETSSLITSGRLDGTNYVEWSLNAQNKIRGRKRWGFISGNKAAPKDVHSEEYEAREDENCLVKSWLLDAMTKDIRSFFLRLATAKEIWEAAKKDIFDKLGCIKSLSTTLRGRMLSTKPLQDLQVVYAMVCAEANRQDAMLGGKTGEGL
ncbi:hypothetical protein Patl1_30256 [Pistacia atlantica]|uniref:Uncharacterized protein n=1 Tax=Pistacia atlantica TaxID=434234 RepID=A0ACC1ACE0_9ROSI|nr:hypothetical protein Patl1_30256 [Pistacia atlantica]